MPAEPALDLFVPASFPRGVAAGVVGRSRSTRDGQGLSFSPGSATSQQAAAESREVLASHLGATAADLVFARQVHGARVVPVARAIAPGEADGMVTGEPGLVLCLSIADCCAILVYDPVRAAVGAFHAGWRGARDGIAAAGLRIMAEAYGTSPSDLRVYLSPCASGERYEVGEEVATLFPHSIRRLSLGGISRVFLDLRGEIARQLVSGGVPVACIESSPVCSIADPRCHSHRRDGAGSGRMAAFIALPLPGAPTRSGRSSRPSGR